MRLFLLCDAGDGLLDLGIRAQDLGHQVRMYLRKYDPRTRPIGKGLVELVNDWRPQMDLCDLCILESNGVYMAEMDHFRRRSSSIIGANSESAGWELDRRKGMEVF